MTQGKQWTPQQETELKQLVETNTSLDEIATKLQKTPAAIIIKCQRLNIKPQTKGYVDTSIPLPGQLPSVEETLKLLAGALKTASKPGLNKIEVQRLQAIATIAKTYKELLADYINYRKIETKLREMEEQNAKLLKEKAERTEGVTAQPNPAPVA
jgi:hypothetical protein